MADPNRNILTEKDKGVPEARGVLAFLFRKILFDMNISPGRWSQMMNDYLDDPWNQVPRNSKDRSSIRGNLNKELFRTRMTWKVFEKGLRFLGPLSIRFEIHLRWPAGRTSVHHVDVELRPDPNKEGPVGPQLDAESGGDDEE